MDLVDAVTVAAAEDDRAFVIGGDLNASRGFDAVYGGKRYATFFADVTKRGFHDCLFALHGAESQSFWGPAAKHAYQLDHVFVDARSGKSVKTARVIDTPETRRLSDHGPVVIDLTDGASAA
jgi:endonuclease/exonuclease/phosphatase family metal-dependent hydrolase